MKALFTGLLSSAGAASHGYRTGEHDWPTIILFDNCKWNGYCGWENIAFNNTTWETSGYTQRERR